ncbi:hypothetical protein Dsin_024937 [Dipteronia sinensis]|uniref:FAD-binding domain-containing protein n=1 Tax=Dipteronia sinensis TaxID=43782 RepID=A0AAD9ZUX0_9ROSI|nr:hypothetical protein Dsin_024937 [Dipteronia sinensis]
MMEVVVVEDVVIVGVGIAGLTTPLGLHNHRLGIRSLVLKSAESLRATGFALTSWSSNARRALDALGIGESLCVLTTSTPLWEIIVSMNGMSEFCMMPMKKMSTLLLDLKPRKVQYSQYSSTLRLLLSSVNSVVAKFLGFKEPAFVGRSAIRGYADYTGSHGLKPKFLQFYDKDLKHNPNKIKQYVLINRRITITYSVQFATIELNGYTYLFDTILRFCPSKGNIGSNNSISVYQNNWKCFKKSRHATYKKFTPPVAGSMRRWRSFDGFIRRMYGKILNFLRGTSLSSFLAG